MTKSKEQLLMEKLNLVSRKMRMGGPGMPPKAPGMHGPGMPPDRPDMEGPGQGPGMGGPGMHPHGPHGGPDMRGPHPHCGEGPGRMPHPPRHGFGGPGPAMPREVVLVRVMEAEPEGIRQKDLAERMGILSSTLSEQIDRLEADRYLERTVNPDDKRSTLIHLTEKGKARAYEVMDERQKAAEGVFEKLTEEEKDTLIVLLDKLLEK